MPVAASLLPLLRCPKSHGLLREATADEALVLEGKWHRAIHAAAPTGFLISVDGAWAYPVRDGVPCLLLDEAITFGPSV